MPTQSEPHDGVWTMPDPSLRPMPAGFAVPVTDRGDHVTCDLLKMGFQKTGNADTDAQMMRALCMAIWQQLEMERTGQISPTYEGTA